MSVDLRALVANPNVRAFLRVIRARESSQDDDAYTVINGGAHFVGFAKHPYIGLLTSQGGKAAGAYQFIPSTWAEVAKLYDLIDFSPTSQNLGAIGRIIYRGALDDVLAGRFEDAVAKCRQEWTSLPGASESSAGWTMEKARSVYLSYGGTLAGTQPAAPIEERSTTLQPTEEPAMGAIALPLLAQLIPQVLGLFSGRAQTVIAEKTGADPKIAADFMQALIAQVGHAVAVPVIDNATATQAVAALTAAPPEDKTAKVQALEAQALATLDALIKALDKTSEWDQTRWDAAIAGRGAASTVAIAEHNAGLWDMTRTIVYTACMMLTIISSGLLAAILVQALTGDRKIDGALIGLAGPIWMATLTAWAAIIAFRFDGTKEGSEQSRALINKLPQARSQS